MSIARSYHTMARSIAEANNLDLHSSLDEGKALVIPIAPGRHAFDDRQTYARRLTVYHVRKNDTVQTVAENLGIPAVTIRRWNRLKSDSLRGRRVLYVHLPISPGAVSTENYSASKSKHRSHLVASKGPGEIHHTVKRGETLYSIATNYRTSVEAIKETNAHVATLRPGMVLLIPAHE